MSQCCNKKIMSLYFYSSFIFTFKSTSSTTNSDNFIFTRVSLLVELLNMSLWKLSKRTTSYDIWQKVITYRTYKFSRSRLGLWLLMIWKGMQCIVHNSRNGMHSISIYYFLIYIIILYLCTYLFIYLLLCVYYNLSNVRKFYNKI